MTGGLIAHGKIPNHNKYHSHENSTVGSVENTEHCHTTNYKTPLFNFTLYRFSPNKGIEVSTSVGLFVGSSVGSVVRSRTGATGATLINIHLTVQQSVFPLKLITRAYNCWGSVHPFSYNHHFE